MFGIALPAFILYIIVIPIGIPIYLKYYYKQSYIDENGNEELLGIDEFESHIYGQKAMDNLNEKFGFLIKGYKYDFFFWESVNIFKKISISILVVFVD